MSEGGDSIIVKGKDLFLNVGRTQLAEYLIGTAITAPRFIAVGTKTTTVSDPRTLTALEDELDREIIESRYRETYTAQLVAVFTRKRAVGEWRELGLFDTEARAVMLSIAIRLQTGRAATRSRSKRSIIGKALVPSRHLGQRHSTLETPH